MCDENGYDVVSEKLKGKLGLDKSPVAIKLVLREEDIPEGIEKIDETIRHCEMVQRASEGRIFFATADEQMCKGGAASIGLAEAPKKVKTGEFYYELGRFSSIGAGKRTMDKIPKIEPIMYAAVYAPLEEANFDPDVIVVICNPAQALKLVQAMVYTLGGRISTDFAGLMSVCADAVAAPYTQAVANITLGCSGSRTYAGIKDDELIVGMNAENIWCIINALDAMR